MEGMRPRSSSSEHRSYTEIEPLSQWMEGDEGDTLILDAKGFSKEQMKVLINTSGRLKISGERPLEGEGNRWIHFSNNYSVPKNCDPEGIQAKFDKEEGLLHVVLPKKVGTQEPKPLPSSEVTSNDSYNVERIQQNMEGQHDLEEKIDQRMGMRRNKVIVASIVVVTIAVIVGIASYLGWRFRN